MCIEFSVCGPGPANRESYWVMHAVVMLAVCPQAVGPTRILGQNRQNSLDLIVEYDSGEIPAFLVLEVSHNS